MAMFLVVVLVITSEVAMENVLTTGRRQREEELIWRGEQFVRAIRLYYRKTGHYPSTLDDLKKGMPELHFLRYTAYKDPMKAGDERTWRFIYVNAAGQIIGSVRYATLQQMAILDMNGGKIPGVKQGEQGDQPGVPASALADQSNANSSNQNAQNAQSAQNPPNGQNAQSGQGAQVGQAPQNASSTTTPSGTPGTTPDNSGSAANAAQNPNSPQPGASPQGVLPSPTAGIGTPVVPGGVTNLNNQALAALAALKPTGPVDGPVLGGFLTGIASTVDRSSIRIYNGGKKYNQWEFIWNPVEEQAKAVQQGLNPAAGIVPGQPGLPVGPGAAGTSGFGFGLGNGAGPTTPNPNGSVSPNPTSTPGMPSGAPAQAP